MREERSESVLEKVKTAARKGRSEEAFALLLAAESSEEARALCSAALDSAIEGGREDLALELIEAGAEASRGGDGARGALARACESGLEAVAEKLMARGALKAESDGGAEAALAAVEGWAEGCLIRLLEGGANPEAGGRCPSAEAAEKMGRTHQAKMIRHWAGVRRLEAFKGRLAVGRASKGGRRCG